MIRLWAQIDALSKPDRLTRDIAKLQAPADDMPGYAWTVEETIGGAVRFRRETPVNTYLITVQVKRKRLKRK